MDKKINSQNQTMPTAKKMLAGAIAFSIFINFTACINDKPTQKLPNTPETVAAFWQECIDKNQYDLARQLSTESALSYLSGFDTSDTSDFGEINEMLNLQCKIIGDSAHCNYHFKDELGELEPEQMALKKIKGQWKVCRVEFDSDLQMDSIQDGSELLFPGDTMGLE